MTVHPDVLKMMFRPVWLSLVVLSVVLAASAAMWVGLQQDAGETSTTYLFGRRVGYLNRPLPVLEDHLNDIVNSVEFPIVFERIEERLLLRAERDYDLTIGIVADSPSVVEIEVRTNRSGEAERIARIVSEEMVGFVLDNQDAVLVSEISDLNDEIEKAEAERVRLVALAGGVPPTVLQTKLEQQLAGIAAADDDTVVGTFEGELLQQLNTVAPISIDYRRNVSALRTLRQRRAITMVERADITASQISINEEWYRSITPVDKTSNVPVAIAMAFAGAVPAGFTATTLVGLTLNRRLNRREKSNSAEE